MGATRKTGVVRNGTSAALWKARNDKTFKTQRRTTMEESKAQLTLTEAVTFEVEELESRIAPEALNPQPLPPASPNDLY
jgi:hypothetical protein